MYQPPQCARRPGCGGVVLCTVCMREATDRAGAKLVKSTVLKKQLPELVQSVWPEASTNETALVAQHLFRSGIAVEHKESYVEHRVWPLLRDLLTIANVPVDPEAFARAQGAEWALPLLTTARLNKAGLHIFAKPHTAKVLARKRTALNAVDSLTLAKALRAKGIKGTALEDVYKEYDKAFTDVYRLAAAGTVTIDENMAWHSSAVPGANPDALRAWQRALDEYKLKDRTTY